MNKRLIIALLALVTLVQVSAQEAGGSNRDASFAPRKGQWEISAHIGNGQLFNQDLSGYLLPTYWNGNSFWNPVGLPGGSTDNQSGDPSLYLNLGSLGENSLFNLVGLQVKYFLTDHLDLNLMFNMNIQMTPVKDFIEGDNELGHLAIQQSQYMEGRLTNIWTANIGSNYYFNTRNERINLYVGGMLGWQMGHIQTLLPYTGETIFSEEDVMTYPVEIFTPNSRAGQVMGLRAAATAGIEFAVAKGCILGFEVQPVSYLGSMIRICPKAATQYIATHHNIGIFSAPRLRLGFRF